MKKIITFLGVGSNLGNKQLNIKNAIAHIKKTTQITVIKTAPFYESQPVGYTNQPYFINTVIQCETELTPETLLNKLKLIEKIIGRKKAPRYGPRIIDIDILFYDNKIINKEILIIPHPEIQNRTFVLYPMNDIAPNFTHPVLNKKISELKEAVSYKL